MYTANLHRIAKGSAYENTKTSAHNTVPLQQAVGAPNSHEAAQVEKSPKAMDTEFGFGDEQLDGAFDESGDERSSRLRIKRLRTNGD